jgi:hypothetical protein
MRGRPGKIPSDSSGYEPVASDEGDVEASAAPGPPNSAFELYEMGIDANAPPPEEGSQSRPSSKSQPLPPGGATSRPKLSGKKKDKSKLMGYDTEFFKDVSTAAVNFSNSSKVLVFGYPVDLK